MNQRSVLLPLAPTLSDAYKKGYSLSQPLVGHQGERHCNEVREAHISQTSEVRSLTSFSRAGSMAGLWPSPFSVGFPSFV